MTNNLKNEKEMWKTIKEGTFVDSYTKDLRTALQKAIDRNEVNLRVERKKEVEDGDIEMFDGKGWSQFCIHKAKKLINEDKIFVGLRQRISGTWINHTAFHTKVFNDNLKDNPTGNIYQNESIFDPLSDEDQDKLYRAEHFREWSHNREGL